MVSTFAGCGGSSLGYKQAHYDVRLAIEWDAKAAATYRRNFPSTPLVVDDICNVEYHEAMLGAGLEEGELDVLDGSPPCQGFSTSGKRRMDDPRSQLDVEYVRLLKAFRP